MLHVKKYFALFIYIVENLVISLYLRVISLYLGISQYFWKSLQKLVCIWYVFLGKVVCIWSVIQTFYLLPLGLGGIQTTLATAM